MSPTQRKNAKKNAQSENPSDIHQKLDEKYNELKALIDSNNQTSGEKVYKELKTFLSNCIGEVKELIKSEHKIIRNDVSTTQQNLSLRLNKLEQAQIDNSIEISGLNEAALNSGNSAGDIASQVLKVYGINSFRSAYLNFANYAEKMHALDCKRSQDKGKKCTVYFNHSLTGFNRFIYMQARKVAKSLNLRTAISHGRIFIRKQNEKIGRQVKSEEDLDEIESEGNRENNLA